MGIYFSHLEESFGRLGSLSGGDGFCRRFVAGDGDSAITFLHGFLLGKSGNSKFNLDVLARRTDAFLDRCLENPNEKAVDVMRAVTLEITD